MPRKGQFKTQVIFQGVLQVDVSGGRIEGYINGGRNSAYVENIHVRKEGQGRGTHLLKTFATECKRIGCVALTADLGNDRVLGVWARVFGQEALSFYERTSEGELELPLTFDQAIESARHFGEWLLNSGEDYSPVSYPGIRTHVDLTRQDF